MLIRHATVTVTVHRSTGMNGAPVHGDHRWTGERLTEDQWAGEISGPVKPVDQWIGEPVDR
jgi:hypothetical protein